ncbi:hypothetical protein [Streptomyces sp. NPDC018045]|uniref:hypothetical protein n=1 Tax=Streptomyces sp. NPDC018045 TaxID=3365037 RepID=UPI00378A3433
MQTELDGAVLRAVLADTGQAHTLLQETVARDPQDGLARALLAWHTGDQLCDARLREQMVRAQTDAAQAASRVRSIVHGLNLFAHRHYTNAASHLVVHLAQFPADALVTPMIWAFTLTEDSDYIKHGYLLAERQYALAGPESWPWAAALAAACAEQDRTVEADRLARHALTLEPRSAPAAHALAHAAHEQGSGTQYLNFVDGWLAADPQVPQRSHLQWHAALQCLAAGDLDGARRRADTELAHKDVGARSAVNWRLLLAGQAPARLVEADHARALLAEPGGMVSIFHTFQLALALTVVGDTPALEDLARAAASDSRPAYAEVLAPVVRALAHVTDGRPGPAIDLLEKTGTQLTRLGGVGVEREIIQDTLARALIDADQPDKAAHLLHHRRTTRRHHAYEDLLLATAQAAPLFPPRGQAASGPCVAQRCETQGFFRELGACG